MGWVGSYHNSEANKKKLINQRGSAEAKRQWQAVGAYAEPDEVDANLRLSTEPDMEDGNCYAGYVDEEGNKQGFGMLIFKDGSIYEGGVKDGKMNGQGRLIKEDGAQFEGEWAQGRINGHGRF